MPVRVRPNNTGNIALLDASALQSWSRTELECLSRRYRLAASDILLSEVVTKPERDCHTLLAKLTGPKLVIASSLGQHVSWEATHLEPVGILLDHTCVPGLPERSAESGIRQLCESLATCHGRDEAVRVRREIDAPDEDFWSSTLQEISGSLRHTELGRDLQKTRPQSFLEQWPSAQIDEILQPSFVDWFTSSVEQLAPQRAKEVPSVFNRSWVSFRMWCTLGLCVMIHATKNPGNLNHARLNQRLDIRYVPLVGEGMTLVSEDVEMQEISQAVSPSSRTLRRTEFRAALP